METQPSTPWGTLPPWSQLAGGAGARGCVSKTKSFWHQMKWFNSSCRCLKYITIMETVAGDIALMPQRWCRLWQWGTIWGRGVLARICDCLRHNIFISEFSKLYVVMDCCARWKKVYHFTSSRSHSVRQEKTNKRNETTHKMMETVQAACICRYLFIFLGSQTGRHTTLGMPDTTN